MSITSPIMLSNISSVFWWVLFFYFPPESQNVSRSSVPDFSPGHASVIFLSVFLCNFLNNAFFWHFNSLILQIYEKTWEMLLLSIGCSIWLNIWKSVGEKEKFPSALPLCCNFCSYSNCQKVEYQEHHHVKSLSSFFFSYMKLLIDCFVLN